SERGRVPARDPHGGFRRVVPSPDPYSIVEAPVIRTLVGVGTIVIASGGGGSPGVQDGPRTLGPARAPPPPPAPAAPRARAPRPPPSFPRAPGRRGGGGAAPGGGSRSNG